MQNSLDPNLINCPEQGFTLRKNRRRFYVENISNICSVPGIQLGHVVTHVNGNAISARITIQEMLAQLQNFVSIQFISPESSRNRFTRYQNDITSFTSSRHGSSVMKRGHHIVIEQIFPSCTNLNIVLGHVILSIETQYRLLETTTIARLRALLNTEVLRHVVCSTQQYANRVRVIETSNQANHLKKYLYNKIVNKSKNTAF
jgi:hypothetical protein